MPFRDEWEQKAHDIICIIKYGSRGGTARDEDVRRVADILRGKPLPTVAIHVSGDINVLPPKVANRRFHVVVPVVLSQDSAPATKIKLPLPTIVIGPPK